MSAPRRAASVALLGFVALVAGCEAAVRTTPPAAARSTTPSPSVVTSAERPAAAPVDRDTLVDKTFDDLKFDILPDAPFERSMLTPAIETLNGQRLRIRGYILPTAQKRGFKQFVLVRDNQECCFGPGAALYDCVLVTMAVGKTAEFSIRPVAVEGRFGIEQFLDPDGVTRAIYRIEGESVR
ncbi:MAG: DUF3299 domain-containing protein [Lacipirellulaceae bacterium]